MCAFEKSIRAKKPAAKTGRSRFSEDKKAPHLGLNLTKSMQEQLKVGSYQKDTRENVAQSRTFTRVKDKESYSPDKNVYYRNNGNVHIPSRGL